MVKWNINKSTFLLTLLLTACSSLDTKSTGVMLADRFAFDGSIAAYYQKPCDRPPCNQATEQGKIAWYKEGDTYNIQLMDPFNRKVLEVNGNDEKAIMTNANSEVFVLDDINAFMEDKFAISLDFKTLDYWLSGVPDPNYPYDELDTTRFLQNNIRVEVLRDGTESNRVKRLIVTDMSTNNRIKIIIRNWHSV